MSDDLRESVRHDRRGEIGPDVRLPTEYTYGTRAAERRSSVTIHRQWPDECRRQWRRLRHPQHLSRERHCRGHDVALSDTTKLPH